MADKIQRSYRIDSDVVKTLDKMIPLYKRELSEQVGVSVPVSPATVIELLVKEKEKQLKEEGKLV